MSSAPTLLHIFPTFDVGGSQIRMATIANHFGRRWRHLILALDGRTGCAERLSAKLDFRLIPPPATPPNPLAALLARRRLLRDIGPSRLVTYNWGSMDWAMANWPGHIPHLHVEDGFGPEEAAGQFKRRILARRWLLRRATVLLPSRTLYGYAESLWRLPRHCLLHVPNGIDCDRFSASRTGPFAEDAPTIGTVAALRPEKNIGRLLDAFARVVSQRPAKLVVIGHGIERPALEAKARTLGIADRVVFTGACPTPERRLPAFDVFALSSDTEQMPMSQLEAMAAGLPIAATDVGDVRIMLPADNHPFVVAKSAERLGDALLDLLADPARASQIGRANAAHVRQHFSQDKMFAAWAEALS